MNIIQQNKKGANKLELKGRTILEHLGLKLDIHFIEQVLMYNKFLVDVLIENKKLIIQWDGEYWHNREKRRKLDISQDKYLNKCGYKVLRITDFQIKNNINKVYKLLEKFL